MNINLHIKNILSSGELDNSVLKKNFITASDGKKYYINFYNLDMILSVGYRVNTKRGIAFRRWASALIKRIIFERAKAKSNNDNLPAVILDFKEDISFIKNNIILLNEKLPLLYENNLEVDNALFFKKDKEKAHIMITGIFAQAKESIVVIDPYMDNTIISYLNEISNHVKWTLITSFNKKKLNEADIKRIEQYYDNVSFYYDEDIHDRFILLDNEKLFCIGSSLKDIPTGLSVIIRIYSKNIIDELVEFTKTHVQK